MNLRLPPTLHIMEKRNNQQRNLRRCSTDKRKIQSVIARRSVSRREANILSGQENHN
jgi:hypothetical protein